MNEIMEKEILDIKDMIYEINGVEVMLDSDLAKLYNVATKRINKAVYRNEEKFPKRISWITNDIEVKKLWSQNATANISSMSRSNPRVFTEQGIYMLATIIKSNVAIEVSIRIMDTFVKELLDILKNVNSKIKIISKNIDDVLKKKYEKQYNNVTFINNNSFHDRFIIIDRNKLYSCGASLKI